MFVNQPIASFKIWFFWEKNCKLRDTPLSLQYPWRNRFHWHQVSTASHTLWRESCFNNYIQFTHYQRSTISKLKRCSHNFLPLVSSLLIPTPLFPFFIPCENISGSTLLSSNWYSWVLQLRQVLNECLGNRGHSVKPHPSPSSSNPHYYSRIATLPTLASLNVW